MLETRVLVVGGSTVGLATAALLAHHGLRPLVIERRAGLSAHPRAMGTAMRTMEVLRELGAVEDLGSNPRTGKITVHTLADPESAAAPKALPATTSTSPWTALTPTRPAPSAQDRIDAALHKAATRLGTEFRFGTELKSLAQDESGVTVTVDGPAGGYQIRAEHVVGADGVRSQVREQLGVRTTGPGPIGTENTSVLFRADLTELSQGNDFLLCEVRNPEAPGMLISMDAVDRWVFHTGVATSAGRTPEELVRSALGATDLPIEVLSTMSWQVNGRLAETFRVGRVFLAGDSAHAVPPLGATGMNSGVADAYNLAWKLAFVHSGRASEKLLDSYEQERLPAARLNLAQALLRMDNAHLHWDSSEQAARERAEIGLLAPFVMSLADRYSSSAVIDPEPELPSTQDALAVLDGAPGSRVPHEWVSGQDLSTVDIAGTDLALLTGVDGQAWQRPAAAQGLRVHALPNSVDWLADRGAVLIRPDSFIAWRAEDLGADPAGVLRAALDRVLTPSGAGVPGGARP
ncbi:FAD-dependent monooxygenase [Kutzneria albida]|uniref:FAD-binding domain-containing protein n=1 Tax=Kutzneria albida DSM 43870 TaxID=1449976 RepID=W5WIV8_9PSEU|nr:FAD-dependent monooxygenase [Kutzneria albida]AHI01119.1 hypothetical protein KALB_7761 [Kutzneria albida DSM 43870]